MKEPAHVPAPVQYRMVMRGLAELGERWADHLEFHSRVSPTVLSFDPRVASALRSMDSEGLEILHQLKLVTAAEWPRSAHAGLISIRARITFILDSLIQHLREERETVLPLLRFWTPAKVVVAAAQPSARVQLIETPVTH